MIKVTVSKMERAEHHGDWHDAPCRWQVAGPGTELQKFSTKKEALLYAKIRRHSADHNETTRRYVATA